MLMKHECTNEMLLRSMHFDVRAERRLRRSEVVQLCWRLCGLTAPIDHCIHTSDCNVCKRACVMRLKPHMTGHSGPDAACEALTLLCLRRPSALHSVEMPEATEAFALESCIPA